TVVCLVLEHVRFAESGVHLSRQQRPEYVGAVADGHEAHGGRIDAMLEQCRVDQLVRKSTQLTDTDGSTRQVLYTADFRPLRIHRVHGKKICSRHDAQRRAALNGCECWTETP